MAKRAKESSSEEHLYGDSSVGTHFFGVTSSVSTETTLVPVTTEDLLELKAESKSIESAVLAHIRAVRALGREQINTAEVAEALNLPVRKVNSVLDQLKERGVRPL